MSRIEPFLQLRYWGLRPSSELEETIADSSAHLRPHRDRIERCQLHVGQWSLHHDQGKLFRATLSIDCVGGGASVEMEEETEVGAPASSRAEVLNTVFSRAASRLAAGG
jgi:hypothetical protein